MTAPASARVLEALPTRDRGSFVRAGALAALFGCSTLEVMDVLRELVLEGEAERYQEGWRKAATKSTARPASTSAGKGRKPTRGTRSSAPVDEGARAPETTQADLGAPARPDPDAEADTPGARHPDDAPAATPSAHRPGKDGATREGREAEAGPPSVAPAGETPSGERAPLGERLRAARVAAGLGQRQLGELLGELLGLPGPIGQSTVSQIERGALTSGGPVNACERWLASIVTPEPSGEPRPPSDAATSAAEAPHPGADAAPMVGGGSVGGENLPSPSPKSPQDEDPARALASGGGPAEAFELVHELLGGWTAPAWLAELLGFDDEDHVTREDVEQSVRRLRATTANLAAADAQLHSLRQALRHALLILEGLAPDSDGDLVHAVTELRRERNEFAAELVLVDRILLAAGTSIDWPRQVRLGQLLDRFTRKENA